MSEQTINKLKKEVEQLRKDNIQLSILVERMSLTFAEMYAGVERYALVQEVVCEVFGLSPGIVAGEFPKAWIRRNPKGLDAMLFGEQNIEVGIAGKVLQARVLICCFHRYVFVDKRRTHGELEFTYPWYSRRQEYSLRKIFEKILEPNNPQYRALNAQYEKARFAIQQKIGNVFG